MYSYSKSDINGIWLLQLPSLLSYDIYTFLNFGNQMCSLFLYCLGINV